MPKRLPVYQWFLGLYPEPYREKYAKQMTQTLVDMLDDQPNRFARVAIWLRVGADLPVHIMKQNVIFAGGIMKQQTPSYVKRNALISTALIVPFFAVVFSRILQYHRDSNSVALQSSLFITLILLPVLAFMLALATLIVWSRSDKKSFWRRLLDVRRSWLLSAVGILALGIALFVPFHDSAHCVIGNPVRVVHNSHQTIQCMSDGFMGGR